jgi:hypothetical protein
VLGDTLQRHRHIFRILADKTLEIREWCHRKRV